MLDDSPRDVPFRDRGILVQLSAYPSIRIVVPERLCPILVNDDGQSEDLLCIRVWEAEDLAQAMYTGKRWILDEVRLEGPDAMEWTSAGCNGGWLYTDTVDQFRSVADAIAQIPHLRRDLADPAVAFDAIAALYALRGLAIQRCDIEAELRPLELDQPELVYLYRVVGWQWSEAMAPRLGHTTFGPSGVPVSDQAT